MCRETIDLTTRRRQGPERRRTHLEHVEPMVLKELDDRLACEQPKMPDEVAAGSTEHLLEAHLRERWLHAHQQRDPVEPCREVRRGQRQVSTRLEHTVDLLRIAVGVHQVLDDVVADHEIEDVGCERQVLGIPEQAGPHLQVPAIALGEMSRPMTSTSGRSPKSTGCSNHDRNRDRGSAPSEAPRGVVR